MARTPWLGGPPPSTDPGADATSADIPPNDLLAALIDEGPLSIAERAAFLKQRYVQYRDQLVCKRTDDETFAAAEQRNARLKAVANSAAFEDLQALLGRRGPLAAQLELALLDQIRCTRDGGD